MAKLKQHKNTIVFFLVLGIFILLYLWFYNSAYFRYIQNWASENIFLFLIFLVIVKVISIVWPPMPGGLFTLGAVPIVGWLPAYISDFIGSMLGSSIAFYLGKEYGFKFLSKFFDENVIKNLKKIKVKKKREIEMVIVLRILTGSIFLEAICYSAGLIGIRYKNFLIGSIASHMIVGIPVYALTENVIESLKTGNLILSLISLSIILVILYKIRGRYLEQ